MEVDIAASTVEKLRTETAGRKERHSSNFRADPSAVAARANVETHCSISEARRCAPPQQRGSVLRPVHIACKWVHRAATTSARCFCGSMYVRCARAGVAKGR